MNEMFVGKIGDIIKDQAMVDGPVHPERRIESFGLDSLDQVELVMAFEDDLGIEVPDDVAGRMLASKSTVRDVATELWALMNEDAHEEHS